MIFYNHLVPFYSFTYYEEGNRTKPFVAYSYCPSRDSRPVDVKVPSLFVERPRDKGNDLCHVRIEPSLTVSRVSDGQEMPLADGYLWGEYASSTNRNWLYYCDHYRKLSLRYTLNYDGKNMVSNAQFWYVEVQVSGYHPNRTSNWVCQTNLTATYTYDPSTGFFRCTDYTSEYLKLACDGVLSIKTEHPWQPAKISKKEMMETLEHIVSAFSLWYSYLDMPTRDRYFCDPNGFKTVLATPSGPLDSLQIFDEYRLLFDGASTKPYAAYHLKAARQQAYLDALDHVPQMNDNNLSNVIELVAFIKGIVLDHRIEIPNSLSSAWLAYRYSYGTTKMDMEEAIDFMHRNVSDELLEQGFSVYGVTHYTINDVTATVRCRLNLKQKELSTLQQIWSALYTYGLSPSFYVVWDMIPYSFIVDWFIPVGDILSGYDTTRMYDRTYDMSDIWFSIKYSYMSSEGLVTSYTRWTESELPEFNGYYTLENKGTPSDKVIGFRVLDALSLIFC